MFSPSDPGSSLAHNSFALWLLGMRGVLAFVLVIARFAFAQSEARPEARPEASARSKRQKQAPRLAESRWRHGGSRMRAFVRGNALNSLTNAVIAR